ncbi:MAG TPA: SGNH/GDSL hydrolase family protein [Hymenobacter sp.]|uniref:SGNH/GDSL hydrolase family protein n=1 Tax=Hymenobacter sp. TaxID=1898978 RepID=UPI002D800D87|nr:SGNH/GDSL hydrolase family protein [Hymenobacter sp.]HET9504998.1 SGNH/GDSL hydrolase family protein [Hymenobacter sp.]
MIFLLGLLTGCATHVPMTTTTPPAATISYLALGDSYTIGEGAPEAGRWPVQLAALAQAQGLPLGQPTIIARTGWTTAELQEAIREANLHQPYGLVSLLIGVNNQYRRQSLAQYQQEFRALLATAVAFAGGQPRHVVVLSIPDWGQTPFAAAHDQAQIAQEINQFNQAAHEECQRAGVAFVDITPLTRAAAGDASQVVADGLHYTPAQMRQWAQRALPVVQQQLR